MAEGGVRRRGAAAGPAGHRQRQAGRLPPDGGFPRRPLFPLPPASDRHEGSAAAHGSSAGRGLRPAAARRRLPGAVPARVAALVQPLEAHPRRRHPEGGSAHPVRRPGRAVHRDADRAAAFPGRQPGFRQLPRARPAEDPQHRAALARAAGGPVRDLPRFALPPQRRARAAEGAEVLLLRQRDGPGPVRGTPGKPRRVRHPQRAAPGPGRRRRRRRPALRPGQGRPRDRLPDHAGPTAVAPDRSQVEGRRARRELQTIPRRRTDPPSAGRRRTGAEQVVPERPAHRTGAALSGTSGRSVRIRPRAKALPGAVDARPHGAGRADCRRRRTQTCRPPPAS